MFNELTGLSAENKSHLLTRFILQSFFFFLLVTQIGFGQWVWTKYEGNPVLTGSGSSTWDKHVMGPWVIFNADSNRYEMFFFASMQTNPDLPYKIGIAYSTDKINWTKRSDPIISPTPGFWDAEGAYHPCVIREDSVYKMWYMAYKDGVIRICFAASTDGGLNWTKYPNPVLSPGTAEWESTGIAVPLVLKEAEGYVMYYSGQNSSYIITKIGRAISTDGINWQRDTVNSPILIAGTGWEAKIFASGIVKVNDIYYLNYCGYTYPSPGGAGGMAFSTDGGLTFQKYPNNPVISTGSSGWDNYFIETDCVIYEDSTFYMWYAGSSSPYLIKIGLATSPIQKPIWAQESYLDKAYTKINTDSILFRTRFYNFYSLEFTSHLIYINSNSTIIDSLKLFDDGLHGDSLANDGIYGRYIPPIPIEDFFKISVSTMDKHTNKYFSTADLERFTTAGPIKLDSIRFLKGITNYYNLRPFVRNEGTGFTITNAKLRLSTSDPWVSSIAGAIDLPSIAPGASVGASSWIAVTYVDSIFPGYFNLTAELSVDGWTYWTDSIRINVITGVEDEVVVPTAFKLEQNFPDPFNSSTKIQYSLSSQQNATIKVFDILGNEIETLVNEEKPAGTYEVTWQATNLPSGIYFYRLQSENFIATKKMVLLK